MTDSHEKQKTMSLEHGAAAGDDRPMTHLTNPRRANIHHPDSHGNDPSTHRRIREAMGPGYQVAIFHETSPLTTNRPVRR
jgi:hypothetical protein